jgi:hypothetical protein
LVGKRERLEERPDLVHPVVARGPDEEAEVELCGGLEEQIAGR